MRASVFLRTFLVTQRAHGFGDIPLGVPLPFQIQVYAQSEAPEGEGDFPRDDVLYRVHWNDKLRLARLLGRDQEWAQRRRVVCQHMGRFL